MAGKSTFSKEKRLYSGKPQDKGVYKKLMFETTKKVIPRILAALKVLKKENNLLYELCSELIKKRSKGFLLRGFLARFSYEIIHGNDWTDILDFCAAVELELASMYYSNRIFDNKGGSEILQNPNDQFIASMLTKEFASNMLTGVCGGFSVRQCDKITALLRKSNKEFYFGQFSDMHDIIYIPKMVLEENRLIKLYIKRCFGINACFFEAIAKMGGILANGSEEQINALGEFGKNYGLALQIVNDIADFVPPKEGLGTSEKIPKDAYADIKQGKLTYPIIYSIFHGKSDEKQFLLNVLSGNYKTRDLIKATRILVQNGSIAQSKKLARKYATKAKRALKIFSKQKRRPLSLMCVIIDSNKYYKALEKYK